MTTAEGGGLLREEMVAEVCRLMEDNLDTWKVRHDIQAEIFNAGSTATDIQQTVKSIMEAKGLATRIGNSAFTLGEQMTEGQEGRTPPTPRRRAAALPGDVDRAGGVGTSTTSIPPAALQEVQDVQAEWQELVVRRLNEYRVRADMPLARRQRTEAELTTLRSGGMQRPSERIGDAEAPYGYLPVPESLLPHYIYDTEDLYRALCSMSGSDPQTGEQRGQSVRAVSRLAELEWGAIALPLPTPSIAELRRRYAELHERHRQVGLDDELLDWFEEERTQAADRAAHGGSIPACRKLARSGVPSGSRPKLWATALCIPSTMLNDISHFEALCAEVENRQLLTDYLIAGDVEAHISTTEDYFLFEEQLLAVLLAFTRDPGVAGMCLSPPHPQLIGMGKGGRRHGTYPPSAVLPFAGLVLLAAPLAYLYPDPAQLYHVFRAMYCRHWCRLHSFAVDGGGGAGGAPSLPSLCRAFEALLQEVEPEVCWHLQQIQCPPLRIAFPWMARAFVGYLQLEQVLLLWDRVVGYDSLMPLAMLAAAIMAFRREILLAAERYEEVKDVMDDLSQMKVAPLLQGLMLTSSLVSSKTHRGSLDAAEAGA